ncbi:MAG TPA: 1,4-dihydroxy-2-naphthoate polyprenyltransferase [Candidatus Deferrimicrobium sp.]|nr:1,4-dihydroxy-2-naphthoate polyprenyltransferase [Candidatus Deferrimicrobium sp.]
MPIWIHAARPKTLWAAVAPVLIGTAMAFDQGAVHWLSAMAALLGAMLIQIGTNFANDYFDSVKGADRYERLGPTRVTQAGLVSQSAMRTAVVVTFGLAVAAGTILVWRAGWPIAAIGLVSIACGILYTAGPYPLAYHGLGDPFVLIFFGPVAVGGTYYVQALSIDAAVLFAGLSPGLFSVAILTVNNLRDIQSDRRAGKRTLAVRFGAIFARREYVCCISVSTILPVTYALITRHHIFSLLTILVVPAALPSIIRVIRNAEGPALNDVLAATGKLLLLYSLLFSIGWLL